MDIYINNVVCSFSVRCHLNLKEIALTGSNVEYRYGMVMFVVDVVSVLVFVKMQFNDILAIKLCDVSIGQCITYNAVVVAVIFLFLLLFLLLCC